ncbi:hypothetical protein [Aliivibrio logei]|uniref:Glycosyltransferase 2-like domain-containing protein n=1 Tax=Aliivibrio logei 5S-186 TaxID=626086 RepID=A0ABX3AQ25_ALILO|nr:hypothetical protein [Aliivibrio logei]OEF09491.1 hypothetical protein A1Q5_14540 [Aliivibrio logei 5S-186]
MTSILVLLYNKEIKDSESLNHIKSHDIHFNNVNLIIWNNGPNELKDTDTSCFTDIGLNTTIINTLDNKSLGYIYNEFIKINNESRRFIFLDHDSYITKEYLEEALHSSGSFLLPKVTSYGALCSPNKLPKNIHYKKNEHIVAIGSGIVINKDIIEKIEKKYISTFDSNFSLYGVDTSFMLRIRKLNLCDQIKIISGFEHSLSKNEQESKKIKKFREDEMAISIAIIARRYPSYSSMRRLIKRLYGSLKGTNQYPIITMLQAFSKGKHPRC